MRLNVFLYILNILVALFIIFYEKKKPSSTVAWIMILFVLPGAGIVLYIIFSQLLARYKLESLSSAMVMKDNPFLLGQKERMRRGEYTFSEPVSEKWAQFIRFNQEYASAYFTQNNEIKIFTKGMECFESMFRDIRAAKKCVDVEFFIMKPDYIGLEFIKLLTEKAREGVQVRLLLDAMGARYVKRREFTEFRKAGGELEYFFPPKIFKLDLKLNYRNHRKITVIDNSIAYIGGLNAAKEYAGDSGRFKGWRDTHLRITGGCVYDIDTRFIMDWNFASGREINLEYSDYPSISRGRSGVQIISSGPESNETEIKFAYLRMINSARRSIYIQSPYMVPDESIFEALKTAALAGLDVRIMIPNRPDHVFVYWVTLQNVGELAKYGAKIYIYEKGFLHAKTIVVDDEAASVGSANFDIRSFELNFECNALIYDKDVAVRLREAFLDDINDSRQLTAEEYENRSRSVRMKESVSRLLSDIL